MEATLGIPAPTREMALGKESQKQQPRREAETVARDENPASCQDHTQGIPGSHV
ncbi:MAG: hypothetical protein ACFCU9_15705 [Cyanophyceae cyanobacterium]